MKKYYLCFGILCCLLSSCTDKEVQEVTKGESCPGNMDANYADDEYSPIQNDNDDVKSSIQDGKNCSGAYPICRSTKDSGSANAAAEEKFYCAHCAAGEIFAKGLSGNFECQSCKDLIQNRDNCAGNDECTNNVERCLTMRHGATGTTLSANSSDITLYFNHHRTLDLFYRKDGKPTKDAKLEIAAVDGNPGKNNDCVNFITDTMTTDENGVAHLEMATIAPNDCKDGKKVTICLVQDDASKEDKVCTDITVRTRFDEGVDANGNLMIDEYETNTDKDKYKAEVVDPADKGKFRPRDCSSYCHDDTDCEDFCDSAIGYRCSKRCTSDDQCIMSNGVQTICRADGRCAYPSFKFVYYIKEQEGGRTVTMGGHPVGKATINWDVEQGGKDEEIPASTDNNLSHTYLKGGKHVVEIKGDYRDWRAGCDLNMFLKNTEETYESLIDIDDILQFGPVGLGYYGNYDDIDYGTFTNCWNFNKISAKDIPDATKLTNMSAMFAGYKKFVYDKPAHDGHEAKKDAVMYAHTKFNNEHVTRWDTSNVEMMFHTFFNSSFFNQDIGKWDLSNVKSTNGMFAADLDFNYSIRCWDMSLVTDISQMFINTIQFNQDLSNWNLDNVSRHESVFRYENGHNGHISLKNYCTLRKLVHNGNIGREPIYNQSTCCGIMYVGRGTLCDNNGAGVDYDDACDNGSWKEVVDKCMEEYLGKQNQFKEEGIVSDNEVACFHLRRCRDCPKLCQQCYDKEGCDHTDPSQVGKDWKDAPCYCDHLGPKKN